MSIVYLISEKGVRELLESAESSGWKARRSNQGWVPVTPMCVYFFDLATGYLASALLNSDEFARVAEIRDDLSTESVREMLVGAITDLAVGRIPSHQENASPMQRFICLIVMRVAHRHTAFPRPGKTANFL